MFDQLPRAKQSLYFHIVLNTPAEDLDKVGRARVMYLVSLKKDPERAVKEEIDLLERVA